MAVVEFQIKVIGGTRGEVIEEMDKLSLEIMQLIGGDPWLVIDDDVARRQLMPGMAMEDAHFAYFGQKTLSFKGPSKLTPDQPLPPGIGPQRNDHLREDD